MLSLVVYAETTTGTYEGLEYSIIDGEVTITGADKSLENIVIPNEIEGYPVTIIKQDAFNSYKNIKRLTLPSSLKEINRGAFVYCTNLEEINIPENIAVMDSPFGGCDNLRTIYYNAENFNYKLSDIESLENVIFGDNIKRIPDEILFDCKNIKNISISNGTSSIGKYAFYNCSNLQNVIIPNSVTSIETSAFYGCSSLTEITLPENITSVGHLAFSKCDNLKTIYYNAINCTLLAEREFDETNTIKNITNVFSCSDNIEKIIFGDKVKTISKYSFYNCKNIKSISFPQSLTKIDEMAFYGCNELKEINISEKVMSIGTAAFANCENLENIFVDAKNPKYYSDDGVLWNKYQNRLLIFPGGKAEYVIPEGITYIDDYAFAGSSRLTNIIIPSTVTDIGKCTFEGSKGIESVICDCPTIVNRMFQNCENLCNVQLGDNVRTIYDAFFGCTNLKEITIPENVTYLYSCALAEIETIYWNAENADGGYNDPLGIKPNRYIKEIYFGDNVNNIPATILDYSKITSITIPDNVTKISMHACKYCDNLTEVIIPNSVTAIGGSAFEGCKNLNRVVIPSSVISISGGAFKNCSDDLVIYGYRNSYAEQYAYDNDIMFSVCDDKIEGYYTYLINDGEAVIIDVDNTISGNISTPQMLGGYPVTEIGSYAFAACRDLTSVTISQGVNSIGSHAFYNCSNLKTEEIPESVNYIGDAAFLNCISLMDINLPKNLSRISSSLFEGCSSLETINIPNTVTWMGSRAFKDSGIANINLPINIREIKVETFMSCKKLKNIDIHDNIIRIGTNAFALSGLQEIELPSSIIEIGASAFRQCSDLRTVRMNNCPAAIGDMAFFWCDWLTDVSFGNFVTWIGEQAFYLCDNLAELTIPKSVTNIGSMAFPTHNNFVAYGYMGSCAEKYCNPNGYTFIKLDKLAEHYFYLIENDSVVLTGTDGLLTGDVIIPKTIEGYKITKIDKKAFMGRRSISSIQIPESVTYIAYNAFSDCGNIILQGNNYVKEYTNKNGISYSENLNEYQFETQLNESTIFVDNGAIQGDIVIDMNSHMESFADLKSVYIAIYCDNKFVGIEEQKILPEIGEKTIEFNNIEMDCSETGKYTMKLFVWDNDNLKPYAELLSETVPSTQI